MGGGGGGGGGGRGRVSFLFFEVGALPLIIIGLNVFTALFCSTSVFDCFLVKTEECAWSGREAFIEKSVFTPSFIPVLKTFWTNKEEKLAFYCTMT